MAAGSPVTSISTAPQKQAPLCLSGMVVLLPLSSVSSVAVRVDLDAVEGGLEGGEDRRLLRQRPADEGAALERAEQQQRRLFDGEARAQRAFGQTLAEHAVEPVEMDTEEVLDRGAHGLRERGTLGRERAAEGQHALLEAVEEQVGVGPEARAGAGKLLLDAGEDGDEALDVFAHEDDDQVLLGREVVVNAGLGDADAGRQVGIAEGRVAAGADEEFGLPEDEAAGVGAHGRILPTSWSMSTY